MQAFINNLKLAWSNLQIALTPVINAVLKFFNVQQGGEFDIVRALIDGVSRAWKSMTTPIRLVITVVKLVLKAIQNWYLTTLARVNMVKELFRRLPNAIRGAISNLVSIITSPFRTAYSGVKNAVDDIKSYVSGIPGAVSSALSGLAGTITKPFSDAYNRIVKEVDKIKAKANEITGGVFAFGGEGAYGGEMAFGGEISASTGYNDNESLKVDMNQNLNLSLDLRNVPNGIDQDLLHGVVVETLTSKEVLESIAQSNEFQVMDSKVKSRIVAKGNRARGVM